MLGFFESLSDNVWNYLTFDIKRYQFGFLKKIFKGKKYKNHIKIIYFFSSKNSVSSSASFHKGMYDF